MVAHVLRKPAQPDLGLLLHMSAGPETSSLALEWLQWLLGSQMSSLA